MSIRSEAVVETAKPSPYVLQLAKHFRHKLDVRFDEREAVVAFAYGRAELAAGEAALVITADAETRSDLDRVEEVIASHLERFGRSDGLTSSSAPSADRRERG